MDLWSKLEKIRNRPQDEKKVLALFLSLGLTAVIAISWATVSLSSFLGPDDSVEAEQVARSKQLSPTDTLGAQIQSLREQVSEVSDILKPAFYEDETSAAATTTATTSEPQLQYLKPESVSTTTSIE